MAMPPNRGGIPFPKRQQPPPVSVPPGIPAGQEAIYACVCGGIEFVPSNKCVIMYDRVTPKTFGVAQIVAFECAKCGDKMAVNAEDVAKFIQHRDNPNDAQKAAAPTSRKEV